MKKTFYALLMTMFFPFLQVFGQCDQGSVEITVTVVTDLNGNENTWTLKQGSTVLLSGGPYTSGQINTDVRTVCVPEGTEMFFTFSDAGANGIGTGYYKVESCSNILAYHTGSMASNKYAWIKAQACSMAGPGESEVYTRIVRPSSMDQISWSITGPGGSPVYGGRTMPSNSNDEFIRTVVPEGGPIEFRILNTKGGGIYSFPSDAGYYEIGYHCITIARGGDDFDILGVVPFTAPFSEQNGNVFDHQIRNVDTDKGAMIRELCEGGYIIAGSTGPENISPLHQASLVKTSPAGDIIWSKNYGGEGNENANAVVRNPDGGFTAAGYQTAAGSSNQNLYVFRTDLNGNLLWEKNFGSTGIENAVAVVATSDGGFLIAGSTTGFGAGKADAYLVKLNASGNPLWGQVYGNAYDNYPSDIVELAGGDFLVVGKTKPSDNQPWNDSENDAWIFRIRSDGSLVYDRSFGGMKADVLSCVRMVDKKSAIAAGYTSSAVAGKTLAYLVKFNMATGDTLWTKAFGVTGTEKVNSMDLTSGRNVLLTGSFGDSYTNTQSVFLTLASTTGEITRTMTVSRPGANISGNCGIASTEGGYVITGETYYQTFPGNRPDMYFMKTGDDGSLVTVPEISGDTAFCEGGKARLQASEIKVESGITYTWSNGATGRSIEVTSGGSYTVTASDLMGNEKTSASFTVREIPSPRVSVTSDKDPRICFGTTLEIKAVIGNRREGTTYSFLWNTGDTDSVLTAENDAKFSASVTDETYGCRGVSEPFEVTVQKPFNNEEICIVTVDPESGKNMIVYSKTPDKGTRAYIIWKETNVAYVYEPIGAVPYNEPNLYIDYGSNPSTQADRYRISVLDVCDNQSLKSAPHKTMHLTVNAGGGGLNANNLIWDHYEGFPFGTYTIYRGPSPGQLDSIHSIQSSLTSWTDDNPPQGDLYYRIGVRKTDPCYLLLTRKASGGPFAYSLSNLEDNKLRASTGMEAQNAGSVLIYPNPYSGYTNIVYSVNERSDVEVSVFNSLGQKVTMLVSDEQEPSDYQYRFSAAGYNQPPGIYLVRIRIGREVTTRMIMEK